MKKKERDNYRAMLLGRVVPCNCGHLTKAIAFEDRVDYVCTHACRPDVISRVVLPALTEDDE